MSWKRFYISIKILDFASVQTVMLFIGILLSAFVGSEVYIRRKDYHNCKVTCLPEVEENAQSDAGCRFGSKTGSSLSRGNVHKLHKYCNMNAGRNSLGNLALVGFHVIV